MFSVVELRFKEDYTVYQDLKKVKARGHNCLEHNGAGPSKQCNCIKLFKYYALSEVSSCKGKEYL